MAKAFAVLLVVVALVAEALFLVTGAGGAPPRVAELAAHLGPWAGHPAIAGAGGGLFLVGTLLLGRGGPDRPYASREALLVLVTATAAALTVAAAIGVGRGWNGPTLAILTLGALAELAVALALCVRIATLPERRKLLFVPGVVGVVLVGTVQVVTLALEGPDVALVYCEICGVLIKGQQEQEVPEGVICDACFESRRAVATDEPPPPAAEPEVVQFNCCYCRSLLRLRAVGKRTRIKCPKCLDHFYLNPDGRLESRLEGNTTAVFQAEVGLSALTPGAGTPAELKTQPIRRETVPGLSKTQPIRRDEVAARALSDAPILNPDAYDAPKLDLLPEEGKKRADPPTAVLRPSEEGRIDLDADGLRKKTAKYQQAKLTGGGGGGKTTTKKVKRPEPPAEEPEPPRPDKKAPDKRADARREERERRAAEAAKKSQALESQHAKQRLGALTLTALSLLPAVVALLCLTMTMRGAGFATRGQVGEHLSAFGGVVERGTRSLGGMLNPHLPPELRLPE